MMNVSAKFQRLAFFLLIATALFLRLQNWYHFMVVDEDTILTMVWGLHLDPLPQGMPLPLPGYPPLFIYLNFLLSLLYREVLLFLGVFASSGEFLASASARLFTLKAGQFLVAILGTLHVVVIWKISREFFDQRVAWLAAILIAFHPHLILNGHIFKSDVPLAFLFSLLILFSLRFLRTLGTREFLAASFLVGMTAACKYNGAVEAFLIPFLLWISRKELSPGRWRKLLLLSPVSGLLGFLVFAPNWVMHPLASFRAAYGYALYHFKEFTFYDQVSSTYGRYVVDLWQTLGPLFLVLFVFGLLFTLLRRKKEELTIVLSLLLYFLVQGRSVFFGSRIILPILGGVALIAAKGAFQDLFSLLKNNSQKWLFSLVVFSAVFFFSLGNVRDSLSLFNLWKTSPTLDEAMTFRKDHIPSIFPFGREGFTPRFAGDRGYWDILGIPDFRLFQGPMALPFLTTGILADHLLNHSPNKILKEKLQFRLREYRVFHKISKPRFSPWDGDILFWYRPHPRLRTIHPNREMIYLPFLFRPHTGNTIFYPRQPYEKDPGFFPLEGSFFGKWILSSRPMKDLCVTLFCPEGEIEAKVKVNKREILLRASKGTTEIIFPALVPLAFQKSPLYRIEANLPENHPPAFLLIQERSSAPAAGAFLLSSLLEGEPFPLFSAEPLPGWVREFYRRTGIDLSLLSLTQEVVLWDNPERSLLSFTSAWTVLSKGVYRIELEAEPLAEKVPASAPPPLELDFFQGNRLQTRALAWEKSGNGRYSILMENPEERIFFRVKSNDFRTQNFLLRSLSLRPDFLNSLRRGMIYPLPLQ